MSSRSAGIIGVRSTPSIRKCLRRLFHATAGSASKERVKADGNIELPLTSATLARLVEKLDRLHVASVAVCLMNSYVNPQHELQVAEYLAKAMPALKISCSGTLSPEIREYERTSTTVLNAQLIPVIAGYLEKLTARMQAEGFSPRLLLVQSNGGVCSAATAAQEPVRLLLSGPSGGSAACALLSQVLGEENIVGVDMGGTSFDVSVVRNGRVNLITQGKSIGCRCASQWSRSVPSVLGAARSPRCNGAGG